MAIVYPSTFVSLQDSIIDKLGLDATNDRNAVKAWINQAYADVVIEVEAFQGAGNMVLTPDYSDYILPAAIARIKWMTAYPARSVGSYGAPLENIGIEQILMRRQSSGGLPSANGSVEAYALVGINQIAFWPTPADADTILVYYTYLPTALLADGDIPLLTEPWSTDLLEYGGAVKAGERLNHPQTENFRALYRDALARFRVHLNRRQNGGIDHFAMPYLTAQPYDRSCDVGWR